MYTAIYSLFNLSTSSTNRLAYFNFFVYPLGVILTTPLINLCSIRDFLSLPIRVIKHINTPNKVAMVDYLMIVTHSFTMSFLNFNDNGFKHTIICRVSFIIS